MFDWFKKKPPTPEESVIIEAQELEEESNCLLGFKNIILPEGFEFDPCEGASESVKRVAKEMKENYENFIKEDPEFFAKLNFLRKSEAFVHNSGLDIASFEWSRRVPKYSRSVDRFIRIDCTLEKVKIELRRLLKIRPCDVVLQFSRNEVGSPKLKIIYPPKFPLDRFIQPPKEWFGIPLELVNAPKQRLRFAS